MGGNSLFTSLQRQHNSGVARSALKHASSVLRSLIQMMPSCSWKLAPRTARCSRTSSECGAMARLFGLLQQMGVMTRSLTSPLQTMGCTLRRGTGAEWPSASRPARSSPNTSQSDAANPRFVSVRPIQKKMPFIQKKMPFIQCSFPLTVLLPWLAFDS